MSSIMEINQFVHEEDFAYSGVGFLPRNARNNSSVGSAATAYTPINPAPTIPARDLLRTTVLPRDQKPRHFSLTNYSLLSGWYQRSLSVQKQSLTLLKYY